MKIFAKKYSHDLLLLGNFNLNEEMKYRRDYSHSAYYNELIETFDPLGLVQLVDFTNWRRLTKGVWKTSILDHVYTNDLTAMSNIIPVETIVGEHVLITSQ